MCNERQIQMSFFSPIHEDIKILKSNSNIFVLLKLYFYVADVAEWSWPLDMKLRNWCCSVSIVWVRIPSRGNQKMSVQKSNSNTVGFHFHFQRKKTSYISIIKNYYIFIISIYTIDFSSKQFCCSLLSEI